ncbi:septation protein spoVG [Eubacterium ventriosum]|uniref:Septation protein spoVG n=1 Tax=Eubacterium ventriosum TaxID=39496 RepID=A0A415LH69_9FIRM|nr:SpoVG family protein [Eubacterium ventriosum]RHL47900.1 septation protein spoVG [Eubacterium ventriosum]
MKYTIKVSEVNKESNIRAMATVVFDDSFKVGSIAVVERKDGELFVAMPQFRSIGKDKHGNDVYKSVCNPITKEFRQELFDNILATYASEQKERTIDTKDGRNLQFKVSVNPFERQGSNIRGIGRIYLNDNFVVNNVSVLQGKENLFVAMPSYKTKQKDEQGKAIYQDVCYPVTKEFREVLYGEVINSYNAAKDRNISKGEDDFMVPGDTELPIMENGAR